MGLLSLGNGHDNHFLTSPASGDKPGLGNKPRIDPFAGNGLKTGWQLPPLPDMGAQ